MAAQDIKISQQVGEEDHWAIIRLTDTSKSSDGKLVTGTWRHTARSYTGKMITFTSDHADHLYWEWRGDARGGIISIGSRMDRASHKEGENKKEFYLEITLNFAKRLAAGRFEVTGGFDFGAGKLANNHKPHFDKGEITWAVEEE